MGTYKGRNANWWWRSPKTKLQRQDQEVLNLPIQFLTVTLTQIQTLTRTCLTPPEDPKENRVRDAPTTHRFIRPSPKTPHALVSPEHSSKVSLSLFYYSYLWWILKTCILVKSWNGILWVNVLNLVIEYKILYSEHGKFINYFRAMYWIGCWFLRSTYAFTL